MEQVDAAFSIPATPIKGRLVAAALLGLLLVLAAALGIGVALGRAGPPFEARELYAWALVSIVCGMSVGLSEILTRYRDEPVLASTTIYGFSYLLLNGGVSLLAFLLLRRYPDKIFSPVKDDLLLTAVVAGFGAMVIMRSSFFSFRSSDGKDYKIGPAIVLDTVFKTIDQKIDRHRAKERQAKVCNAVAGLKDSDFDNVASYIEASLLSFQNLSVEEKAEVADVIKQYRQPETSRWPGTLKILGLGFAFLNIAGDANFDQMVGNLKEFLRSQSATQP